MSFASDLIFEATLLRNHPAMTRKLLAEVGYATSFIVAGAETVCSLTACISSITCCGVSSPLTERSVAWLKSSAFSIPRSALNLILNPCTETLTLREEDALEIFCTLLV